MNCRPGCGACCIAPSISSAIPGMPGGKPAGERCVQLDANHRCLIFGRADRPAVCSGLAASLDMCGSDGDARASGNTHALRYLTQLELLTAPP